MVWFLQSSCFWRTRNRKRQVRWSKQQCAELSTWWFLSSDYCCQTLNSDEIFCILQDLTLSNKACVCTQEMCKILLQWRILWIEYHCAQFHVSFRKSTHLYHFSPVLLQHCPHPRLSEHLHSVNKLFLILKQSVLNSLSMFTFVHVHIACTYWIAGELWEQQFYLERKHY